jgi:hypothetical protein
MEEEDSEEADADEEVRRRCVGWENGSVSRDDDDDEMPMRSSTGILS